MWPVMLATFFDRVFTFEPEALNHRALEINIKGIPGIVSRNCALGREPGSAVLQRDRSEEGNAGAWYTVENGPLLVIAVDQEQLSACDLIQLDVEGSEEDVLRGAEDTIRRYRPVVVIEEKALPHAPAPGGARALLGELGYREAFRIHRDVVFVP